MKPWWTAGAALTALIAAHAGLQGPKCYAFEAGWTEAPATTLSALTGCTALLGPLATIRHRILWDSSEPQPNPERRETNPA